MLILDGMGAKSRSESKGKVLLGGKESGFRFREESCQCEEEYIGE